jgi:high-affinity iron transporter
MQEFAAQVRSRVAVLPDSREKPELVAQAGALGQLVADKAAPAVVAESASKLRWSIVGAYNLQLAPRAPPDVARGKALYATHCAACHGAEGRGDGPAAKGLEPAPSNFQDYARMAQRSAYGLYSTITLGVAGTSMAPFKQLSDEDRWALAFYVSALGVPSRDAGEKAWRSGAGQGEFAELAKVATLSRNEMRERYGESAAGVQAYLLAHPQALQRSPIEIARQKLAQAKSAYAGGRRDAARNAAVQAYLDGFELAEASLANIDADLVRQIEAAMMDVRAGIERGMDIEEVTRRARSADTLLTAAAEKLGAGALSAGSAFAASLLILLREGLEAILVLAAIIALVARTGRREALRWVHAGWIAALVLGALTWVVASFLIDISGANREITEGITALLAAAVLLYVGYWLHGKSYAQAWARFIEARVGQALARRTRWAMAALSFLAVYREMFEIVLFYQALWIQAGEGGRAPLLAGAGVAAVLLAVIGVALFKYSLRLPIGPFFRAMSALLAVLAVIFAGHGMAALQEAGLVASTRLGLPAVPLLGLYPSVETLATQALTLLLIALGAWTARRNALASPA